MDGVCQNATVTARLDINETTTTSDDITLLSPPQTVRIGITVQTNASQPQPISLSVFPANRASLDVSTLSMGNGDYRVITLTPLARSLAVRDVTIVATSNSSPAGSARLTIVNVVLPIVRATNTPAGMRDRIPPRVESDFDVVVEPHLGGSGQSVTLSTSGTSGANGDFTIRSGASSGSTISVVNTGSIQLRGIVQTAATNGQNAGQLRVLARVRSVGLLSSNGFSVAAIPVAIEERFCGVPPQDPDFLWTIGAVACGVVIADSGDTSDLNAVEVFEHLETVRNTNPLIFRRVDTQETTVYGNQPLRDVHAVSGDIPITSIFNAGSTMQRQAHSFTDHRTGVSNIPIAGSGYEITMGFAETNNQIYFYLTKFGVSVVVGGFNVGAGLFLAPNIVTVP